MTKVGRNELCPCNSGKKFKKCHGRGKPGSTGMQWMGVIAAHAKNAQFKLPGLSGINLQLVMQAGYKDPSSWKNVSNLTGEYKVVFTLSRPGFSPVPHGVFSPCEHLQGDSHLAIAPPALKYADGREYDYDALVFSIRTEARRVCR